ncbi:MAG: hypothetical protein M1835_005822, partial [Candelina submexicana]
MVHSLQPSGQDDHGLFDQHPLIYQYVPSSTRPQDGQVSTLPPPANPSTILPFVSSQPPLPSVPPIANDLNASAHILLPNESEPPPPYPCPDEFAPAPNLVTQIRIDLEADIHPYFANYDRLTNNIHPLFRRQNFITQSCPADEPILLPRDQYAFLEPVLRLASRLITHHSALSAWARFLFPNATDPVAEQHRSASAVLEALTSTLRFCIGEKNALSQQPHRTLKVTPRRVFTAILTATTSTRWADALMHQFGLAILFIQLIASSLSLPLPRATTDTTTSTTTSTTNTTHSSAFHLGSDDSDIAAERITRCMFGVRGLKVVVVPCGFGRESVTVQHTSRIKEGSDVEGWFP